MVILPSKAVKQKKLFFSTSFLHVCLLSSFQVKSLEYFLIICVPNISYDAPPYFEPIKIPSLHHMVYH